MTELRVGSTLNSKIHFAGVLFVACGPFVPCAFGGCGSILISMKYPNLWLFQGLYVSTYNVCIIASDSEESMLGIESMTYTPFRHSIMRNSL